MSYSFSPPPWFEELKTPPSVFCYATKFIGCLMYVVTSGNILRVSSEKSSQHAYGQLIHMLSTVINKF